MEPVDYLFRTINNTLFFLLDAHDKREAAIKGVSKVHIPDDNSDLRVHSQLAYSPGTFFTTTLAVVRKSQFPVMYQPGCRRFLESAIDSERICGYCDFGERSRVLFTFGSRPLLLASNISFLLKAPSTDPDLVVDVQKVEEELAKKCVARASLYTCVALMGVFLFRSPQSLRYLGSFSKYRK